MHTRASSNWARIASLLDARCYQNNIISKAKMVKLSTINLHSHVVPSQLWYCDSRVTVNVLVDKAETWRHFILTRYLDEFRNCENMAIVANIMWIPLLLQQHGLADRPLLGTSHSDRVDTTSVHIHDVWGDIGRPRSFYLYYVLFPTKAVCFLICVHRCPHKRRLNAELKKWILSNVWNHLCKL
ncbi:hypothetical protein RB195_018878 [Necator americanus]|uniref:Neurotransmitter-gated ion-channel ligand-binding domain-containing protein n=1 Tax=Necator americanus TaxID=51031 RepID=A0ABR1CEI5_NECAM